VNTCDTFFSVQVAGSLLPNKRRIWLPRPPSVACTPSEDSMGARRPFSKGVLAMEEKQCTKCREVKPLAEYYKDRRRPRGLQSKCRSCANSQVSLWRQKNKSKVLEQERRRFRDNPQKRKLKKQRYRDKWPEKTGAQQVLRSRVYRGTIQKPSACSACGASHPKHLIQGHHEDYSKPLDVIWMCASCHNAIHN